MDRRLAEKNLRTGLFAAGLAVAVFTLAFIFATYYLA
jgi:hypothetical protein